MLITHSQHADITLAIHISATILILALFLNAFVFKNCERTHLTLSNPLSKTIFWSCRADYVRFLKMVILKGYFKP